MTESTAEHLDPCENLENQDHLVVFASPVIPLPGKVDF
jgi:hypothetical protein